MDKKEALKIVQEEPLSLEELPAMFKKDKEVVLEAVTNFGDALEFADKSLKKDKEIVIEAVTNYGPALEFADERFKKDKRFILDLAKLGSDALEFAHESLKKDKEIILEAVKKHGSFLRFADESLKRVLESVGFKGSELVGFETDDFDEEFYSYDDENAVMPIVPKWNEKYSAVIILSDNLMDDNFLKNFFKVESAVDYKTSRVAPNFVITAKKFIEYLRNYNE